MNISLQKILPLFGALAAAAVGAGMLGRRRWAEETRRLRAGLDRQFGPVESTTIDSGEIANLPAPVHRFFQVALAEGQRRVAGVRLRHTGTFNLSPDAEQWRPFTSDQRVVIQPRGFDWDARIRMLPGIPVHVHDAFVAGEGILHASVLGLVTVADQRGTGEIAEGELMRFLAEAAWYPTALLPSEGIAWEAVDDRSAHATLTEGSYRITLLYTFGTDGLIDTVRAEARGRTVGKRTVPTPWQGRFWNYVERAGMRIPLEGEVAWLLPDGERPYWRGRISEVEYHFRT